jgi:hypothetical protein
LAVDGKVRVASAGHLQPYLDGEELAFDTGRPLGIDSDALYAESSLTLASGTSRTPRHRRRRRGQRPHTRELFGFDRTQAISMSAHAIDEAAHSFGLGVPQSG